MAYIIFLILDALSGTKWNLVTLAMGIRIVVKKEQTGLHGVESDV